MIKEKQKESEKLKNIVERHNTEKGFNLASALIEQEEMIKSLASRLAATEEALAFFANWYNRTQESNILIPENLKNEIDGKSKLIL